MPQNSLLLGLGRYFSEKELAALASATVGIAGAGGLGSNAALMLARCGVGGLRLIDCDVVDASNLNRQQYWPADVGRPKVRALADLLLRLNPELRLEAVQQRISQQNAPGLLAGCPIWVEALDDAAAKAMLVEQALMLGLRCASASGMGGYGGEPMRKKRLGRLTLVGDYVTDIALAPPLAPRVTQAAAMLADAVLEFILGDGGRA